MSLVVYPNSVNSTKFDQPMYTVIHMQDPGSIRITGHWRPGSGHGSVSLTRFHLCSVLLKFSSIQARPG